MVVCGVDDLLISGKNDQEHLIHPNEVLATLERAGLRFKLRKCKFMQPTVEYPGYRIDAQGIHAIEKKVEAIRKAPAPVNQHQLRSFLGMINYYSKFIGNYSTIYGITYRSKFSQGIFPIEKLIFVKEIN